MLVLNVLQGPDRGLTYDLPDYEPQLIGRSTEALPLTDASVSRRHAELTPDNGAWYLRDLDSANGTFINGYRLRDRVRLSPGDQIRCGSTLFVLTVRHQPLQADDAVLLVGEDELDSTIDSELSTKRADPNDESMVLAAPDAAQAASDHLRVLYRLSALTTSVFDREVLLSRVMDLVFDVYDPDRGFILLQQAPDTPATPAVVRYKTRPRTVDEGRIPVSRTIIDHVLRQHKGILSTNAMSDERFRRGDSVRDYDIRSAICVPMIAGGTTFGVIHIDSSLANFTFTESQLRLLTAIGQHTALALHGSQLLAAKIHTDRLAAVGKTMAALSHSIKNILQGLRSGADAVELALNRGDLELAKEGWPILGRNLDRIFALTMNMLTYARPRDLDLELTNLSALVREAVELMQAPAERRKVTLFTDLDDDLPPVPIDANAIHQALMNLLMNAVQAAESKTGVVTISTRFNASNRTAELMVADNGPGIPPEIADHVFEAFITSKGQRGTGLGLAVTRKIVQEHQGTIQLDSPADGDGVMVTITLPIDAAIADAGETEQPQPRPAPAFDPEFDEK